MKGTKEEDVQGKKNKLTRSFFYCLERWRANGGIKIKEEEEKEGNR